MRRALFDGRLRTRTCTRIQIHTCISQPQLQFKHISSLPRIPNPCIPRNIQVPFLAPRLTLRSGFHTATFATPQAQRLPRPKSGLSVLIACPSRWSSSHCTYNRVVLQTRAISFKLSPNWYSRTRQTQDRVTRSQLAYASTSAALALLGIYTLSEADQRSESAPGTSFRSLLGWWTTSPDTSAPPTTTPAPPTPEFQITTPDPTFDMTSNLPGRPETLTAEQEAKLKEFWNAALKLFGQSATDVEAAGSAGSIAEDEATSADPEPTPLTRTDSEVSLKKKRKFFSRSSKKDKEKDKKDKDKLAPPEDKSAGASPTPSPPPGLSSDPEDKYNQNKDFKAALASMSPTELRTTFWSFVKYDNPDGLLLRFLRARKWDVDKALVMMVSTMVWRAQEVHVEDIVKEGELHAVTNGNEGFLKQLRIGKSYVHGIDKENRPVCIVSARLHRAADQPPESLERYTIYLIETTRMLLKPPVDTACILFDMTGFGLSNMDYAPVKFMIKCFEAHYPECLGVCLVHNAPWVFQGVWKIIKGWLDPVVASKVHFTSNVDDLSKFISKSQLPKFLQGEEDFTYEYVEPVAGENPHIDSPTPEDLADKSQLEKERLAIINQYEQNTRQWIKEESKGANVNTDVKDERSDLRERLKVNYWGLDKYLRAKTYYDRVGMLSKNGTVNFYPTAEKKEAANTKDAVPVPAHRSDEELD